MAIQGLRNQEDIIAQFQDRPESWRQAVMMLEPNGDSPLLGMTSALSSGSSETDSVIHWFEEDLPTYRYLTNGAKAVGATTLTVHDGAKNLKVGDLLEVPSTGEHVLVNTDPTTDESIVVTRAFGGAGTNGETAANSAYGHKAATAIGDNVALILIGSIYGEGGRMPEPRTFNPLIRETFCQIQKDTIAITGSTESTEFRTGDPWVNDKRRCLKRHSLNLERSFFFSRKFKGQIDGKIAYRMSGILEQIPSTQVTTVPDTGMDLEAFEELTQKIFLWGSNEKMAFVGNTVMTAVQQMVRRNNTVEIGSMVKEYGMQVRRLHTPHGTLVLKTHPQFNYIPEYNKLCVVLDMPNIKYCYKKGRDTQWLQNLEENDLDGKKSGYMTDCALQVQHQKTHYLIKNWGKGKKDS